MKRRRARVRKHRSVARKHSRFVLVRTRVHFAGKARVALRRKAITTAGQGLRSKLVGMSDLEASIGQIDKPEVGTSELSGAAFLYGEVNTLKSAFAELYGEGALDPEVTNKPYVPPEVRLSGMTSLITAIQRYNTPSVRSLSTSLSGRGNIAGQPTNPGSYTIKSYSYWQGLQVTAFNSSDVSFYKSGDSGRHYPLANGFNGMLSAYRASGSTTYLHQLMLCIDWVIYTAKPGNLLPDSTWKNPNYLCWPDYTQEGSGDEINLNEFYLWRHIAIFIDTITGLSGNYPGNGVQSPAGTYAAKRATYLAFLEKHIWEKWYSRGMNRIYRAVIHISTHSAVVAMILREHAVSATIRSQAAAVHANIDHIGQPSGESRGLGSHIRKYMEPHPRNSNAYFWYWWGDRNTTRTTSGSMAATYPGCSDVSHGGAPIDYVIECILRGYYDWNISDMIKFCNLLNMFCPDASKQMTSTGAGFIDGTIYSSSRDLRLGFISLGAFERKTQANLDKFLTASGNGVYGRYMMNTKLLSGGTIL